MRNEGRKSSADEIVCVRVANREAVSVSLRGEERICPVQTDRAQGGERNVDSGTGSVDDSLAVGGLDKVPSLGFIRGARAKVVVELPDLAFYFAYLLRCELDGVMLEGSDLETPIIRGDRYGASRVTGEDEVGEILHDLAWPVHFSDTDTWFYDKVFELSCNVGMG